MRAYTEAARCIKERSELCISPNLRSKRKGLKLDLKLRS
jgi:hypothetical protein